MSEYTSFYQSARSLQQRISTLSVEGKSIQEYFLYEGYNFWQAYQTDIFVESKRFYRNRGETLHGLKKATRIPFFQSLVGMLFFLATLILGYVRHARVVVYSVDKKPDGPHLCDFRLSELYQALNDTHTPFRECLHSPSVSVMVRHAFKRGRVALYTNCGDFFTLMTSFARKKKTLNLDTIETETFAEEELVFVRLLIRKLESEFARVQLRVRSMRFMLRAHDVKVVYCIDDVWHYFELMTAALLEGVHVTSLQHGHFTKYHVGMFPHSPGVRGKYIMPNTLSVWTHYWREELMRLGSYIPQSSIVVGGLRDSASLLHLSEGDMTRGAPYGVLVPYETDAPKERILPYMKALRECTNTQIYFKPRPDVDVDIQLTQYGLSRTEERVHVCTDLKACLPFVHVTLGTYTSLLYDMILCRAPVILLTEVLDYGEGMLQNNLAVSVKRPEELCGVIEREALRDESSRTERRERLMGGEARLLKDTLTTELTQKYVTR